MPPGDIMNTKPSNAALAILLGGAAIVAPAMAQDAGKPTPGANLQYVGTGTRIGIGVDSDGNARGEVFQVLQESDKSASLVELWASRNAGGAKLSHHWTNGTTAVNKVFAAFDQGDEDRRKATLGGGQEYERWFWNASVSKSLSSAKLTDTHAVATTVTNSGVEASSGRPYQEDVVTTVTTRSYVRPYDWGVGARAGHFYEPALLRLTAGVDYEWGKYSSKQWTGTLSAEKFFAGSPISVAITGEIYRRSGDFEGTRNDQRGFLMLRYELGNAKGGSFRPSKVTRTVTSTERVPDPNWKPVAAVETPTASAKSSSPAASNDKAVAGEPTTRIEKRAVRSSSKDDQETYFDLGSARLKPAALKELDALASRIASQAPYVDVKVNVVGHTCPTGSDRNNFALSSKRAEAVKAYLVGKGIAAASISTTGKAGKEPKYPEVKGQSFRNRRADTEVIVFKEKIEEVKVPVAASQTPGKTSVATGPAVVSSPATNTPAATAPMIERQVQREVVEDVPNNWITRALHNTAQHKTAVDTYRYAETATAAVTGARRYLNRAPAAVADSYTVDCGAATTFNVLANDTDPDGDALTITSVSTPGKGTATISGNKIVYTPGAATCSGATDSFTYTITDPKGATSTATVAVKINAAPVVAPNDPPVAVDDRVDVPCNGVKTLSSLLANDYDPNGDPLKIIAVTQPVNGIGKVSISADGKSVNYDGTGACYFVSTFTYTISDGRGGTSTATVTLVDP